MLHNESRNLLVQAFEKNHNAKQTQENIDVINALVQKRPDITFARSKRR